MCCLVLERNRSVPGIPPASSVGRWPTSREPRHTRSFFFSPSLLGECGEFIIVIYRSLLHEHVVWAHTPSVSSSAERIPERSCKRMNKTRKKKIEEAKDAWWRGRVRRNGSHVPSCCQIRKCNSAEFSRRLAFDCDWRVLSVVVVPSSTSVVPSILNETLSSVRRQILTTELVRPIRKNIIWKILYYSCVVIRRAMFVHGKMKNLKIHRTRMIYSVE